MEKITFIDNVTKANAETFNTTQDNIEDAIDEVSTDLTDEINNTIEYIDEKNTYSTDEIRIGTWVNSKPLYRKVITRTVNANTNDSVSLSTLGITNQDTIIINIGLSTAHYQISTTGGGYAPIVYYVSNTDRSHVYVNANKELQIQNQNNNQREYNIVLEYTKTTD